MAPFALSYKWLSFSTPTSPPRPVPSGLERHFIKTPSGQLEILSASTSAPNPSSPPIFFCHGGMGSAWVWTEYMQYLSTHNIPCYAVSLRGHGDSWHPSFLRMVYFTTRGMLEDDLVAGVKWAQEREGRKVVLVGHSSGGGLSQGIMAQGKVDVEALALLGAVPAYGSMGVYMNWANLDPWFIIRLLVHAWHPNSPLSHPFLTKRAFFCDSFPMASVIPFQRRLSQYESYLWPLSMMRPFATAEDVMRHVVGGRPGARVLVMSGTQDKLMTPEVTRATTAFYRAAAKDREDVQIEFVQGAGHHLQNDIQWEDGASKLYDFYKQVIGS